MVNRLKTRPWIVKNDTRGNSARTLRPGIIQGRVERKQVPNGEGQRSMVSCFTVIRSAIPTIFHGKIVVGDIQVGDIYICERVCKFVCYGSRRSYFFARNFLFIFFLSRQLTGATVSLLQVTMWIYKDSRFYTRRSYIRIFMLSFISIRRNIETMPLIKRHLTPSAWGMIRESRQLNYSKIYSKYDFVLDIFEYS